jgi:hypothetical protein
MRKVNLALAALLVLGAAGCKKEAPPQARIDAALAPLMPADTVMAACLRLDRLKKTPLWDKYIAPRQVTALEEFRARTGLDPLKDVWEIVAVTNGRRVLFFVRGKFGGQFGLEPRLEIEGLQRLSHKGYNIVTGRNGGVLFLNTGAAVVGDVEELKKIIDNRDNPKEAPPQALLELVKNVPGGAHAWAVTTSGAAVIPNLPPDGLAGNAAKVAASLGQGWLWADLSQGVKFHAEGVYANGESARQINDALRGLVGIVRLKTPDNQPELLRVYDGINVRAKDRTVQVDFNLAPELIDRLVDVVSGLGGGRIIRKS